MIFFSFSSELPYEPIVSATNLAYQSSAKDECLYENNSLPTTPIQTRPPVNDEIKAWSDIGQYTDIPGPLPGFLRNEEMLQVPTVSNEIMAAATNDSVEKKLEEAKPMSKSSRQPAPFDDYVDPQDVKDEVAARKEHKKISKKMSTKSSPESKPFQKIIPSDANGDYTLVSDALPQGTFEKVNKNILGGIRDRTSSDVSPVRSSRSGDSGKGSDSSPGLQKKSHSLNRKKRPQHVEVNVPSKSQLSKRRSTTQQKEMVSFDPQGGFKLTAKRTNSDGTPRTVRNEDDSSPVSDPGRVLGQEEGEGYGDARKEQQHVYAAVDLTAKCRPEDDLLRRDGVGVPEHYTVTCN